MANSINNVKNQKAIHQVTNKQAFELLRGIYKNINSFGSLRSIMKLTKNFAYSLSEIKPTDDAIPAVKIGKKSFYLASVGQVNETNVLNVIKSVLKVEDAKRVLARRLSKRLTFEQFSMLSATDKRLDDIRAGVRLAGMEMTGKQVKDTLHRLYDEYLQSMGFDE